MGTPVSSVAEAIGLKGNNVNANFANSTVIVQAGGNPSAQTSKEASRNEVSEHRNENLMQLPGSIVLFRDRLLAQSNGVKVFAGEAKQDEKMQRQGVDREQLAIKMIGTPTDENFREAKNLQTLIDKPHSNVVSIKHTDCIGDHLFIAMHRCSKLNLDAYFEDRRKNNIPINLRLALDFSKQIVDGLQHIHSHDILHRNLKPDNVLLSKCESFVKICAFGLSKQLKNGLSVTKYSKFAKSTIDVYRAPETYERDEITKMADVFCLGLLFHHVMSNGLHPYGDEQTLWMHNIKFGKNLDLSRLCAPFNENATALLSKMLQKNPEDRPTVEEVQDHLLFKFDWLQTLLENFAEIWRGTIKDKRGKSWLPCTIYQPKESKTMEFGDGGWTFEMTMHERSDIGSLKKVTDEKPSGYFVVSRSQFKRLANELGKKNKIAWIDVSKGKDSKVFILLSHKDYRELFGFFLPSPEAVKSLLQKFKSRASDNIEVPTPTPPPKSNIPASSAFPDSDGRTKEPTLHPPKIPRFSAPQSEQQTSSPKEEPTKANSDLIPWWTLEMEELGN